MSKKTNPVTIKPIDVEKLYKTELEHQEKRRELRWTSLRNSVSGLLRIHQANIETLEATHKKHNDYLEALIARTTDQSELSTLKKHHKAQLEHQEKTKAAMFIEHCARVNGLLHAQQAGITAMYENNKKHNDDLEAFIARYKAQ